MRWFTKAHRPGRSGAVLRARLSLESLDGRFAPTSLDGIILAEPETTKYAIGDTGDANRFTPQITEFTAQEIEPGLYMFAGRVEGLAVCGGLTVSFGGVPSLMGKFAVTDTEGCFMLQVAVRTDGSDDGMVIAQTVAGGVASNVAQVQIAPSA